MAKCKTTGAKVASAAGKLLATSKSKSVRAVAASGLSQVKQKKKGR